MVDSKMLCGVKSTIATLDVVTEPKKGVTKVAKVSVVFGSSMNYLNVVNRRRKKLGLEPVLTMNNGRTWGHKINGTPLIWHNGKEYLECLLLKTLKETYYKDCVEVSKEEALPKKNFTETYELGKDSPQWRVFKLESIKGIKSRKLGKGS
jgi:hypothetical protein